VEVEAVGVEGSRLPDDAVGDAAVALLGAEEGAQLLLGLLRVDVRPDDGVKAGVPEPLEGVGDGGGDAEGVGLAVDGRDAAAAPGPFSPGINPVVVPWVSRDPSGGGGTWSFGTF